MIPHCTCAYGPRVNLEFHAAWCEFRQFYEAKESWEDEEAKERRLARREAADDAVHEA
jgi:hypothetical protein